MTNVVAACAAADQRPQTAPARASAQLGACQRRCTPLFPHQPAFHCAPKSAAEHAQQAAAWLAACNARGCAGASSGFDSRPDGACKVGYGMAPGGLGSTGRTSLQPLKRAPGAAEANCAVVATPWQPGARLRVGVSRRLRGRAATIRPRVIVRRESPERSHPGWCHAATRQL